MVELLDGGEDHAHGDNGKDPHVWLDPMRAKQEMANIKDAFVKADPENKDYYEANYEKYAGEFDELDQEFRDVLKDTKSRDIIVAHEAFGYLCNAYDLTQLAIEGLTPDSEPDPAKMQEVIEYAKKYDIHTIFFVRRYICRLSPLIISVSSLYANATANGVFPEAVGPNIVIKS